MELTPQVDQTPPMAGFNERMAPAVQCLATTVLTPDERTMADSIARHIVYGGIDATNAIRKLQCLIGTTPKRPLYYLHQEIGGLPDNTRNVVRYAGDYIDQLIKLLAFENGDYMFRRRALSASLGVNLKRLRTVLPPTLHQVVHDFNEAIYVPAKHRWDTNGLPHLFSATEAVFICFIMSALARLIVPISQQAASYASGQVAEYHNNDE